jgi:XTP/dITP diphosphohydrolase
VIHLYVASRNAHKVAEIQAILGKSIRVHGLAGFSGAPDLIEDAPTFGGNATRKALQFVHWLGGQAVHGLVLADDSGLEVDALNGAPGVRSARFAASDSDAGNSPDAANNQKLLELLQNIPIEQRTARFRCVLALSEPGQHVRCFEGVCEGRIAFEPAGGGGFGYDPLFIPTGYSQSFAELGEEIKNRISHRARALQKLKEYFNSPSRVPGEPTPPTA